VLVNQEKGVGYAKFTLTF